MVPLKINLPSGSSGKCNPLDVFYILGLSYNLVSVAKAEHGKVIEFTNDIVGLG